MIQRCTNPNRREWSNYGGRGINVCERWRNSFVDFLTDMGSRPSPEHEIDRYPNNDGNYEPGNVRWATRSQQMRNTRQTIFAEVDGERKALADASDEAGINHKTVYERVQRGWDENAAVKRPIISRPTLNLRPGEKYSHLTVIKCLGKHPKKAHHLYLVQCKCGALCERTGTILTNGKPQWCYINCPVRLAAKHNSTAKTLCTTPGCGRPARTKKFLCYNCQQNTVAPGSTRRNTQHSRKVAEAPEEWMGVLVNPKETS